MSTEQSKRGRSSENSCDLPVPTPDADYQPKVDLTPGLSSFSTEHPTRVWNSLLHSCPPEHQPDVKWEFTAHPSTLKAPADLTQQTVIPPK